MPSLRAIFAAALAWPCACFANTAEDQYVYDNLTATLYHELGHALVHQLDIPIYGQEEDAADVLSSYLITRWNDAPDDRRIAHAVAVSFYAEFVTEEDEGADTVWDSLHGPALQRMYNHLCVFIGADTNRTADFANTFDMDQERATDCDVEYDMAQFSWGFVIDDLIEEDEPGRMVPVGALDNFVGRWAEQELARINGVITFPQDIPVVIRECGEFNAYYDSEHERIEMCLEQDAAFRKQYQSFSDSFRGERTVQ